MNRILSFQEEVDVTRRQVVDNEYMALLVWGWTTVAISTVVYLLDISTGNRMWEYLWLALPVIGGALHVMLGKKEPDDATSLYLMLARVSRMIIAAVAVSGASAFFCEFNVWSVIVLILSLWAGFSAFMLDYRSLRPACIGGVAIAVGLLYVRGIDCMAVFSSGVAVTLLLPGYIMRRDSRRER